MHSHTRVCFQTSSGFLVQNFQFEKSIIAD